MVEHSNHPSKVEGLSPAAASRRWGRRERETDSQTDRETDRERERERERESQIYNIRVMSICQKKYHFKMVLGFCRLSKKVL